MRNYGLIALFLMLAILLATVANATGYPLAIHLTDGTAGWYKTLPPTVTTELKVDDKSAYSKQLFPLSGDENLTGPADLSAQVWLGYDANRVYVHGEIMDDVITNIASIYSMFLGDSAEFGFAQSDNDIKRATIIVRPTTTDKVYSYRPDGGEAITLSSLIFNVATKPGSWSFDASILQSEVGLTGTSPFRFNLMINDSDDPSSIGQDMTVLGLRSGASMGYKDLSVWSNAVFVSGLELTEVSLFNSSAKKLINGTSVRFLGLYVTLVSARDHCFFVEDQSRTVGLKINFPTEWNGTSQVEVGQIVDLVSGKMRIRDNQRELDADSITVGIAGRFIGPEPLCIRGKDLGGTDPYGIVPHVGGLGPSNIGLLVRVVGKIKDILPTGFVLSSDDDITVYYSGALAPEIGSTVSVTGVVTTNASNISQVAIEATDSLVVY